MVVASLVAALWYDPLYQILMRPYLVAVEMLAQSNPNLDTTTVIS